jgi:Mg-chelatase subunit ChlD
MDTIDTLTRWRLMLGGGECDGTGQGLGGDLHGMDAALDALYECERRGAFDYNEPKDNRKVGRGASQPGIARWLGDIRKYFPQSVVQVMQDDALRQEKLRYQMILEPEILAQAVPDVHLLATILSLKNLMPDQTRDTARRVVQEVLDNLLAKIQQKTIQSISGALHRSVRNYRPRLNETDWNATILKNLRHYQPQYKSIIPETRIGYGRKTRRSLKDVVLCLDQSGSMGTSVVYTGIFGAVMASIPAIKTHLIAYDTAVVDLTDDLHDPVELLFGVQLGGGNDTNKALRYCQQIITKPDDTILVLISDLFEGHGEPERQMRRRMEELVSAGVQLIVLTALNDEGTPSYEKGNARFLQELGVPVFACTPDLFPDLMAAAIARQDLRQWAGDHGLAH